MLLHTLQASLLFENCIIQNNQSQKGELFTIGSGANVQIKLTTILENPSHSSTIVLDSSANLHIEHSLIWHNRVISGNHLYKVIDASPNTDLHIEYSALPQSELQGEGVFHQDPRFQEKGNPTLRADSPYLNAGRIANGEVDYLGRNRKGPIDFGAYESSMEQTIWQVSTSPQVGEHSLAEALSLAQSGDFVEVAAGYYELNEANGLELNESIQIIGAGSDKTFIISQGSHRIFDLNSNANIVLSDLSLSGGRVTGYGHAGSGGAIRVQNGYLTLERCQVFDNSATYGGAIAVLGGEVLLHRTALIGNSSSQIGAAFWVSSNGKLSLNHVTCLNNSEKLINNLWDDWDLSQAQLNLSNSILEPIPFFENKNIQLKQSNVSFLSKQDLSNHSHFLPITSPVGPWFKSTSESNTNGETILHTPLASWTTNALAGTYIFLESNSSTSPSFGEYQIKLKGFDTRKRSLKSNATPPYLPEDFELEEAHHSHSENTWLTHTWQQSFLVVANTKKTLTLKGKWNLDLKSNGHYQVIDFHVLPESKFVDRAFGSNSADVNFNSAYELNKFGLDSDHSADLGAYETHPEKNASKYRSAKLNLIALGEDRSYDLFTSTGHLVTQSNIPHGQAQLLQLNQGVYYLHESDGRVHGISLYKNKTIKLTGSSFIATVQGLDTRKRWNLDLNIHPLNLTESLSLYEGEELPIHLRDLQIVHEDGQLSFVDLDLSEEDQVIGFETHQGRIIQQIDILELNLVDDLNQEFDLNIQRHAIGKGVGFQTRDRYELQLNYPSVASQEIFYIYEGDKIHISHGLLNIEKPDGSYRQEALTTLPSPWLWKGSPIQFEVRRQNEEFHLINVDENQADLSIIEISLPFVQEDIITSIASLDTHERYAMMTYGTPILKPGDWISYGRENQIFDFVSANLTLNGNLVPPPVRVSSWTITKAELFGDNTMTFPLELSDAVFKDHEFEIFKDVNEFIVKTKWSKEIFHSITGFNTHKRYDLIIDRGPLTNLNLLVNEGDTANWNGDTLQINSDQAWADQSLSLDLDDTWQIEVDESPFTISRDLENVYGEAILSPHIWQSAVVALSNFKTHEMFQVTLDLDLLNKNESQYYEEDSILTFKPNHYEVKNSLLSVSQKPYQLPDGFSTSGIYHPFFGMKINWEEQSSLPLQLIPFIIPEDNHLNIQLSVEAQVLAQIQGLKTKKMYGVQLNDFHHDSLAKTELIYASEGNTLQFSPSQIEWEEGQKKLDLDAQLLIKAYKYEGETHEGINYTLALTEPVHVASDGFVDVNRSLEWTQNSSISLNQFKTFKRFVYDMELNASTPDRLLSKVELNWDHRTEVDSHYQVENFILRSTTKNILDIDSFPPILNQNDTLAKHHHVQYVGPLHEKGSDSQLELPSPEELGQYHYRIYTRLSKQDQQVALFSEDHSIFDLGQNLAQANLMSDFKYNLDLNGNVITSASETQDHYFAADTTPPPEMSILTSQGNHHVKFSWTFLDSDRSLNEADVDRIVIWKKSTLGSGNWEIAQEQSPPSFWANIFPLENRETYQFKWVAFDRAGNYRESDIITATPSRYKKSFYEVSSFKARAADTKAHLTWEYDASLAREEGVIGFKIYKNQEIWKVIPTHTLDHSSHYEVIDLNLSPNTIVNYHIKTIDQQNDLSKGTDLSISTLDAALADKALLNLDSLFDTTLNGPSFLDREFEWHSAKNGAVPGLGQLSLPHYQIVNNELIVTAGNQLEQSFQTYLPENEHLKVSFELRIEGDTPYTQGVQVISFKTQDGDKNDQAPTQLIKALRIYPDHLEIDHFEDDKWGVLRTDFYHGAKSHHYQLVQNQKETSLWINDQKVKLEFIEGNKTKAETGLAFLRFGTESNISNAKTHWRSLSIHTGIFDDFASDTIAHDQQFPTTPDDFAYEVIDGQVHFSWTSSDLNAAYLLDVGNNSLYPDLFPMVIHGGNRHIDLVLDQTFWTNVTFTLQALATYGTPAATSTLAIPPNPILDHQTLHYQIEALDVLSQRSYDSEPELTPEGVVFNPSNTAWDFYLANSSNTFSLNWKGTGLPKSDENSQWWFESFVPLRLFFEKGIVELEIRGEGIYLNKDDESTKLSPAVLGSKGLDLKLSYRYGSWNLFNHSQHLGSIQYDQEKLISYEIGSFATGKVYFKELDVWPESPYPGSWNELFEPLSPSQQYPWDKNTISSSNDSFNIHIDFHQNLHEEYPLTAVYLRESGRNLSWLEQERFGYLVNDYVDVFTSSNIQQNEVLIPHPGSQYIISLQPLDPSGLANQSWIKTQVLHDFTIENIDVEEFFPGNATLVTIPNGGEQDWEVNGSKWHLIGNGMLNENLSTDPASPVYTPDIVLFDYRPLENHFTLSITAAGLGSIEFARDGDIYFYEWPINTQYIFVGDNLGIKVIDNLGEQTYLDKIAASERPSELGVGWPEQGWWVRGEKHELILIEAPIHLANGSSQVDFIQRYGWTAAQAPDHLESLQSVMVLPQIVGYQLNDLDLRVNVHANDLELPSIDVQFVDLPAYSELSENPILLNLPIGAHEIFYQTPDNNYLGYDESLMVTGQGQTPTPKQVISKAGSGNILLRWLGMENTKYKVSLGKPKQGNFFESSIIHSSTTQIQELLISVSEEAYRNEDLNLKLNAQKQGFGVSNPYQETIKTLPQSGDGQILINPDYPEIIADQQDRVIDVTLENIDKNIEGFLISSSSPQLEFNAPYPVELEKLLLPIQEDSIDLINELQYPEEQVLWTAPDDKWKFALRDRLNSLEGERYALDFSPLLKHWNNESDYTLVFGSDVPGDGYSILHPNQNTINAFARAINRAPYRENPSYLKDGEITDQLVIYNQEGVALKRIFEYEPSSPYVTADDNQVHANAFLTKGFNQSLRFVMGYGIDISLTGANLLVLHESGHQHHIDLISKPPVAPGEERLSAETHTGFYWNENTRKTEIEIDVNLVLGSDLLDGYSTVLVNLYDSEGESYQKKLTEIVVDNQAPDLSSLSPLHHEALQAGPLQTTLEYQELYGIDQVRVYLEGENLPRVELDIEQGYVLDSAAWLRGTTPLPTGDYTLVIELDDYIGNTGVLSTNFTITTDVFDISADWKAGDQNEEWILHGAITGPFTNESIPSVNVLNWSNINLLGNSQRLTDRVTYSVNTLVYKDNPNWWHQFAQVQARVIIDDSKEPPTFIRLRDKAERFGNDGLPQLVSKQPAFPNIKTEDLHVSFTYRDLYPGLDTRPGRYIVFHKLEDGEWLDHSHEYKWIGNTLRSIEKLGYLPESLHIKVGVRELHNDELVWNDMHLSRVLATGPILENIEPFILPYDEYCKVTLTGYLSTVIDVLIDQNLDGNWESVYFIKNKNDIELRFIPNVINQTGVPIAVKFLSLTESGESVESFKNFGNLLIISKDNDDDGKPDITPTLRDFNEDGLITLEDYDPDGDGILRPIFEIEDLNGDGLTDIRDADLDGDGQFDNVYGDTDFDGILDVLDNDIDGDGVVNQEDYNNNSTLKYADLYLDHDADGIKNIYDQDWYTLNGLDFYDENGVPNHHFLSSWAFEPEASYSIILNAELGWTFDGPITQIPSHLAGDKNFEPNYFSNSSVKIKGQAPLATLRILATQGGHTQAASLIRGEGGTEYEIESFPLSEDGINTVELELVILQGQNTEVKYNKGIEIERDTDPPEIDFYFSAPLIYGYKSLYDSLDIDGTFARNSAYSVGGRIEDLQAIDPDSLMFFLDTERISNDLFSIQMRDEKVLDFQLKPDRKIEFEEILGNDEGIYKIHRLRVQVSDKAGLRAIKTIPFYFHKGSPVRYQYSRILPPTPTPDGLFYTGFHLQSEELSYSYPSFDRAGAATNLLIHSTQQEDQTNQDDPQILAKVKHLYSGKFSPSGNSFYDGVARTKYYTGGALEQLDNAGPEGLLFGLSPYEKSTSQGRIFEESFGNYEYGFSNFEPVVMEKVKFHYSETGTLYHFKIDELELGDSYYEDEFKDLYSNSEPSIGSYGTPEVSYQEDIRPALELNNPGIFVPPEPVPVFPGLALANGAGIRGYELPGCKDYEQFWTEHSPLVIPPAGSANFIFSRQWYSRNNDGTTWGGYDPYYPHANIKLRYATGPTFDRDDQNPSFFSAAYPGQYTFEVGYNKDDEDCTLSTFATLQVQGMGLHNIRDEGESSVHPSEYTTQVGVRNYSILPPEIELDKGNIFILNGETPKLFIDLTITDPLLHVYGTGAKPIINIDGHRVPDELLVEEDKSFHTSYYLDLHSPGWKYFRISAENVFGQKQNMTLKLEIVDLDQQQETKDYEVNFETLDFFSTSDRQDFSFTMRAFKDGIVNKKFTVTTTTQPEPLEYFFKDEEIYAIYTDTELRLLPKFVQHQMQEGISLNSYNVILANPGEEIIITSEEFPDGQLTLYPEGIGVSYDDDPDYSHRKNLRLNKSISPYLVNSIFNGSTPPIDYDLDNDGKKDFEYGVEPGDELTLTLKDPYGIVLWEGEISPNSHNLIRSYDTLVNLETESQTEPFHYGANIHRSLYKDTFPTFNLVPAKKVHGEYVYGLLGNEFYAEPGMHLEFKHGVRKMVCPILEPELNYLSESPNGLTPSHSVHIPALNHVSTLNVYHNQRFPVLWAQDFSFPAYPEPMTFQRTYRDHIQSGPFGQGWQMSFNERVLERIDEDNDFEKTYEYIDDMGRLSIMPVVGESLKVPPGYFFSIYQDPETPHLIEFHYGDNTKKVFKFNDSASAYLLSEIYDREENLWTLEYDVHAWLDEVRYPNGHYLKFNYHQSLDLYGRLEWVEAPRQHRLEFEYVDEQLEKVLLYAGEEKLSSIKYTYDENGYLMSVENGSTGLVWADWSRGAAEQEGEPGPIQSLHEGNQTIQVSWTESTYTDPMGAQHEYEFPTNSPLVSSWKQLGDQQSLDTVYEYYQSDEENHLLKKVTTPTGRSFNYEYKYPLVRGGGKDRIGMDLVTRINEVSNDTMESKSSQYTYLETQLNDRSFMILKTEQNYQGLLKTYHYNNQSRLVEISQPGITTPDNGGPTDLSQHFEYDEHGQLIKYQSWDGRVQFYTYYTFEDSFDQVNSYNLDGQISMIATTVESGASFNQPQLNYSLDEIIFEAVPKDFYGNTVSRASSRGATYSYKYEAWSPLLKQSGIQFEGGKEKAMPTTTYELDEEGRVKEITRKNPVVSGLSPYESAVEITTQTYDDAGRVISTTRNDSQLGTLSQTYDYDNGKLESIKNENNTYEVMEYDSYGRLEYHYQNLTAASSATQNFKIDSQGRHLEYNANGLLDREHLLSKETEAGSILSTLSTSYFYDIFDQVNITKNHIQDVENTITRTNNDLNITSVTRRISSDNVIEQQVSVSDTTGLSQHVTNNLVNLSQVSISDPANRKEYSQLVENESSSTFSSTTDAIGLSQTSKNMYGVEKQVINNKDGLAISRSIMVNGAFDEYEASEPGFAGQTVTKEEKIKGTTYYRETAFGIPGFVTSSTGQTYEQAVDAQGRIVSIAERVDENSIFRTTLTEVDNLGFHQWLIRGNQATQTIVDAQSRPITKNYYYDFSSKSSPGTLHTNEAWTYDYLGRVKTWTRKDGQVLVYHYDQYSQLESLYNQTLDKTLRVFSDYDAFGTPLKTIEQGHNGNVITTRQSDAQSGLVLSEKTEVEEGSNITLLSHLKFGYDKLQRLETLTYTDNSSIKLSYNDKALSGELGPMNKIEWKDSIASTYSDLYEIIYDEDFIIPTSFHFDGQEIQWLYFSKHYNLVAEQTFNGLSYQIEGFSDNLLRNSNKQWPDSGSQARVYTYDSIKRLMRVDAGSNDWDLFDNSCIAGEDQFENRKDDNLIDGENHNYINHGSKNQISTFNGVSFTYNDLGNLTADDRFQYQRDSFGRITRVTPLHSSEAITIDSFNSTHLIKPIYDQGYASLELEFFSEPASWNSLSLKINDNTWNLAASGAFNSDNSKFIVSFDLPSNLSYHTLSLEGMDNLSILPDATQLNLAYQYVDYIYDASGRRVLSKVLKADNTIENIVRAYEGMRPVEIGSQKVVYSFGINTPICTIDASNQKTYYLTDSRGSVLGSIQNGAIVSKYKYSAWGQKSAQYSSGNVEAVSGYTGMIIEPYTGMYHTHYRDYDWRTGRWDREDPAGYMDGLNLYNAYFDVNGYDPDGLDLLLPQEFGQTREEFNRQWTADFKAIGDKMKEKYPMAHSYIRSGAKTVAGGVEVYSGYALLAAPFPGARPLGLFMIGHGSIESTFGLVDTTKQIMTDKPFDSAKHTFKKVGGGLEYIGQNIGFENLNINQDIFANYAGLAWDGSSLVAGMGSLALIFKHSGKLLVMHQGKVYDISRLESQVAKSIDGWKDRLNILMKDAKLGRDITNLNTKISQAELKISNILSSHANKLNLHNSALFSIEQQLIQSYVPTSSFLNTFKYDYYNKIVPLIVSQELLFMYGSAKGVYDVQGGLDSILK